jgi:hypothetical protein
LEKKNYKADLPKFVGLNRNLMWVPTSVLNAKAAFSQRRIFTEWTSVDKNTKVKLNHSFEFSSIHNNPLPLAEHSKIIDTLLALYANNLSIVDPNNIGGLHFKMCDLAAIAGRKYTEGFRKSVAEAIYRYMRCLAFWQNAYLKNGMRGDLSCTLIEENSLWDQSAGKDNYMQRVRNPKHSSGSSKDRASWHYIKFNQRVADVLHEGDTRLFLSEIIKSDLRPLPYIVYRYFYAFSDSTPVERSLAQLQQVFTYGRKEIFLTRLREHLDEIVKYNLIENYVWPERIDKNWNDAILTVKCKSFTKNGRSFDIPIEKLRNIDLISESDLEAIKTSFYAKKYLADETISAIENLKVIASHDIYINTLRSILKTSIAKFDLF